MDKKVSNLLSNYPELECIQNNKTRCTLTGHEMPTNYESIHHYVNGTKFLRMKRVRDQLRENENHFEDRGSHLYCKLTKRNLAKMGEIIENHINGRRFKNALRRAAQAQDENGNRMETNVSDDDEEDDEDEGGKTKKEPRLIDDSDASSDDDEDIVREFHRRGADESSTSSRDDSDDVDNGYPELAGSDHENGGGSDYDFNAMDTDLDAEAQSAKRKTPNVNTETPANKRRRC